MADTILARDNVVASAQSADINELSAEETKHFLTPFAFTMDKSLFGLPLASPAKRAFALLIDLSLIALLSYVSGGVLALAIAITLYRLGKKHRVQARGSKGYKRRAIMRFTAALILFFVLLDTIPPLLEFTGIESKDAVISMEGNPLSLKESLAFTGYAISTLSTIADSECKQLECWQKELRAVAHNMAKIHLKLKGDVDNKTAQVVDIFAEISDETKLDLTEQAQLNKFMFSVYQQALSQLQGEEGVEKASKLPTEDSKAIESNSKTLLLSDSVPLGDIAKTDELREISGQEKTNKPIYSVIELIKGIVNDLGLGFGWATFYFTGFIALKQGQTIGKKILGIKVLQLDGTPLSLWDSFGRYGGYGAGIATGLLGFIQIYWDPNRQAIHDKISATVVIDISKARLTQNAPDNE